MAKNLVIRHKVVEGEWFKFTGYDGCCDCGLVHRVEARIFKTKTGHRLEMRCWREETLSKETRRRFKYVAKIA